MTIVIKAGEVIGIASLIMSTILSQVYGFDIVVGNFEISQRHPELKKCAADILQKDQYVAVRRSRQTGKCENLPRSWGKNEAMEDGYDYAKKITVKEIFDPPRGLVVEEAFNWMIPGVFKTGSKVVVELASGFHDGLYSIPGLSGERHGQNFTVGFLDDKGDYERLGLVTVYPLADYDATGVTFQITLAAKRESVGVYSGGEERLSAPLETPIDTIVQIALEAHSFSANLIKVLRIQFNRK